MTEKRRYRLLCPVARALDAVGDRWSLLILRDLHAAPARFGELQTGLGIASNLLTTRLVELQDSGLIQRVQADGHESYALTDLGRATDPLLWELVKLGALIDRDPRPRSAGNLRTLVLPLRHVLGAVDDPPTLAMELVVDDETFAVLSGARGVEVAYGPSDGAVDTVLRTEYEALLDVSEGRISLDTFASDHLVVDAPGPAADAALGLFVRALAVGGEG